MRQSQTKDIALFSYKLKPYTTRKMCDGFSDGWDAAHQATVNSACESFRTSMRQAANLLNHIKRGAGEIIDIEKSVEAFRKSLMP